MTHDSSTKQTAASQRVAIRAGLLAGSLDDLSSVRLAGCRCDHCGETSFGERTICPNCGRESVRNIALADHGTLWTYTVVRHRPPGDYRGPEPFAPFGLGLVEMPDGLRVMSPIDCPVDRLQVGLALRFKAGLRQDKDGREVVTFSFEPLETGAAS